VTRRSRFSDGVLSLASTAYGLALPFACACAPSPGEATASHGEAVVYGAPSGPEEDAVVFVIARASTLTARCTGTLVAPNLVITARHCVAEFAPRPFTCTPEGELAPGSEGGTMGAVVPPENVRIVVGADPGFNPRDEAAVGREIFSVETSTICRSDIAMVVLDRDIPNMPVVPMRLGRGNEIGERLRVVGYGLNEDAGSIVGTRRTRSGIRIEEIGESEFLAEGDPVPPRMFLTLGSMLCNGDSGGPAFLENGAITGVWSQVVGDCKAPGARNYFTQIAPFENTIVRPAFEAAGHEPLLEDATGSGAGGAPAVEGGAGGEPSGSGGASGGAEPGVGGAPSQAGATSAEGGTPGTPGGEAGVGGEPGNEPPTYHGPRKSGGLKCEMSPNAGRNGHAAFALLLLGLAAGARRARTKERGS